jgi:hypothetical protein
METVPARALGPSLGHSPVCQGLTRTLLWSLLKTRGQEGEGAEPCTLTRAAQTPCCVMVMPLLYRSPRLSKRTCREQTFDST